MRKSGAADKVAMAMERQRSEDKDARDAVAALSRVREEIARIEERLKSLASQRMQIEEMVSETLDIPASRTAEVAGLKPEQPLPEIEKIDAKLDRLKRERERLGGVNLRAEQEATETEEQLDIMVTDREDLIAAIAKLRTGISSLNREGRQRLTEAFEKVNAHFTELFTKLFGGGTAELTFVESDDPLEAGLEIIARPPGKRPQTMTLLSGGEQALTAMSLIFAVFLTNPAPICVLDEVDAPLDDANVERFCNLMDPCAKNRHTLCDHHPQSDHHGADGPLVWRDHGRKRHFQPCLRRPHHGREFPGRCGVTGRAAIEHKKGRQKPAFYLRQGQLC